MRTLRLVYWAPAQNQSRLSGKKTRSPPTNDVAALIKTGKSEASDAFECLIAADGLLRDIAFHRSLDRQYTDAPTGEYGHYRCSSTLVQILISFFTSIIDD